MDAGAATVARARRRTAPCLHHSGRPTKSRCRLWPRRQRYHTLRIFQVMH